MSIKISDKRILKVIEGLTMGELGHDDPVESLTKIYKYAHFASTCTAEHEDWRTEFLELEKWLIDNGIIGSEIKNEIS